VRTIGRHAFRVAGVLTSGLRAGPDYLIIGAKRGGTTTLSYSLLEHPAVLPMFSAATVLPMAAHMKGAHYFDTNFSHGPAWYRSHFPTRAYRALHGRRIGETPGVSGEASPYYLFHPQAAARAAATAPEARVIVLLRDPVERAYSHYKEQRRRGQEPLESFEAALDAEPTRLAGERERLLTDDRARSFSHEHLSYVAQSEYLEPLREWQSRFPPEQFLVLFSEDLYRAPQVVFDRVLKLLGLSPYRIPLSPPRNESYVGSMAPVTRRRLESHFASHDEALSRHLAVELPWARSR
jgi:hypothetical protein